MKKVLIITYHFPPLNNIIALHWKGISAHMSKFGWEPIVLTTNSEGSLLSEVPEDNIIRVGQNYGSQKVLVSEEGYRGIPKILKPFYFLYKNQQIEFKSIDRFLFSWGKKILEHKERIKKTNPDVIIASYLPATPLWLGRILSKRLGIPWVADFRDACSLYNTSASPIVKFLDRKIDKFLIKSASKILTVSPYLASTMEVFYKRPVEIIYNAFNKTEIPVSKEKRGKNSKIIYYAGRFHSHRLKSVKLLIDWLAKKEAKDFHFVIRSLGPQNSNNEILAHAKKKKVLKKIKLLKPALVEVISREEKEADILVLFEDLGELGSISRGSVTGKLFEYLPFQAPILAIAREDSDIGEILRKTSRGYLIHNLRKLDSAMKKILNNQTPDPNWAKVEEYSHESQCKILCNLLNKVIQCQQC